jgi:KDO2-lipid IV(A) lauroyltransferase
LARLVHVLPLPWALALGRGLGAVVGGLVRYRRAEVALALRCSLPQLDSRQHQRILAGMYRHLGQSLVEMIRLIHDTPSAVIARVEFEGTENLRRVREQGRGALLLAAHLGNWEVAAAAWASRGQPVALIAKAIKNGTVNALWTATREKFGMRLLSQRGSYAECLRALRQNEAVACMLDQNMTSDEGLFVEFFGRPACTTPGLAMLAARTGVAVVPVQFIRLAGGRHLCRFLPALPPPPNQDPASLRAATQEYTAILETMIRDHPEQWIWVHRRWRTAPDAPDRSGYRPTPSA